MEEKEQLDELLPVGSIVLLRDAKKKLMIAAIMQIKNDRIFDYLGVPYPEGYIGAKSCILFDHENISEVVARGYEDAERKKYLEFLKLTYEASNQVLASLRRDSE